ncbi:hypothetical protein GOBAR_AA35917 [Gossypium barbadense]|uniref:Uncharacterized protein n=1 Tax=Gossypium barbadense TaxID=3634 RepID=A0A2P5W157_GOSBA|nr:hypothetical protein GOBAR_AA35917 [Gossypium barbadense]
MVRKVILESVILTAVVVVALTLYTFWAARRGHDFNFLGPFLFGAVIVLMVFSLIQYGTSKSMLMCSNLTVLTTEERELLLFSFEYLSHSGVAMERKVWKEPG